MSPLEDGVAVRAPRTTGSLLGAGRALVAAVVAVAIVVPWPASASAGPSGPASAAGPDRVEILPALSAECTELFDAWVHDLATKERFATRCLSAAHAAFEFRFPQTGAAATEAAPATKCSGFAETPWPSSIFINTIGYGAWVSCDGAMLSVYIRAELQLAYAPISPNAFGSITETTETTANQSFALATGNYACAPPGSGLYDDTLWRTYAFVTGLNSAGQLPSPMSDEAWSGSIRGETVCPGG